MSAKLSELFDALTLPPSLADGRVLKIVHNETKNTVMMNIGLDETVSAADILSVGEQLTAALDGAEVSVFPKYHSSLFSADYLTEIIALLRSKFGAVNGYLNDVDITDDGDTYEISLKSGGRDILLGMEIDKKIEKYVLGFFEVRIHILFTGTAELDIEQVLQEEQSAPLPVIHFTPQEPAYSSASAQRRVCSPCTSGFPRHILLLLPLLLPSSRAC